MNTPGTTTSHARDRDAPSGTLSTRDTDRGRSRPSDGWTTRAHPRTPSLLLASAGAFQATRQSHPPARTGRHGQRFLDRPNSQGVRRACQPRRFLCRNGTTTTPKSCGFACPLSLGIRSTCPHVGHDIMYFITQPPSASSAPPSPDTSPEFRSEKSEEVCLLAAPNNTVGSHNIRPDEGTMRRVFLSPTRAVYASSSRRHRDCSRAIAGVMPSSPRPCSSRSLPAPPPTAPVAPRTSPRG